MLAGLSPNSVSAENVGLKDVNSLVNAQVSGVNLVNSIELAGSGTITEPVNIEPALGLLDTRISNAPTPSSLSVKDDAQAIISSAAKFATNAELGDVTVVTATGASVADVQTLVDLSGVVTNIEVDSSANLLTFTEPTGVGIVSMLKMLALQIFKT